MIAAKENRISVLDGVIVVTLMAVLAGLILPKSLIEAYVVLFGVFLILAGVPHGATDYFLYRQLAKVNGHKNQPIWFFTSYGILMGAYLLVWWLLPSLALFLFIIVSAYHFGQSNWSRTSFKRGVEEMGISLFWGAAIIGVPILLHFEQASTIILEMTGSQPVLTDSLRAGLVFLLIFGNVASMIGLLQNGTIGKDNFYRELRNFICLMLLFFTTPLMIGFGVYFVFWHSLMSILDQVDVVRSIDQKFGFKKYLKETVPLSLMAFAGLGLLYYFFGEQFDFGENLGALFLFISVITVPHSFLMEWLYRTGSSALKG